MIAAQALLISLATSWQSLSPRPDRFSTTIVSLESLGASFAIVGTGNATTPQTGTMVGSSWFADRNWDRVREHAVAYMMIDQPGMLGTTRWSAHSTLELREFHESIEKRMLRNRMSEWHRAPKIGDSSFFGLGIPTFWAEGGFTPEELAATENHPSWTHMYRMMMVAQIGFALAYVF